MNELQGEDDECLQVEERRDEAQDEYPQDENEDNEPRESRGTSRGGGWRLREGRCPTRSIGRPSG
eukprot:7222179-Heterocapsa_arctica.AAC.1